MNSQHSRAKKNWSLIRKVIKSTKRLSFLNQITLIDLKLFLKEKEESSNSTSSIKISTYTNLSLILQKKLGENFFNPLQITNPLEEQSELNDFYSKKDNTGNIQLWPCEEILAVYCLMNIDYFKDKHIIELGSGFSGFCSLAIAKHCAVGSVVLTDGNQKCVDALKENIKLNFGENQALIKAERLLWDQSLSSKEEFDVILLSECTYNPNYHDDLLYTINAIMKKEGECILVSPPRGQSLELFMTSAREKYGFQVIQTQDEISFVEEAIDSIQNSLSENDQKIISKFTPFLIKLRKE